MTRSRPDMTATAGPALAAGAAVAGAFAGERLGAGQGLVTGAGALFCAIAALLAYRRRGAAAARRHAALLLLCALVLAAGALMQRALAGLDGPVAEGAERGDHVAARVTLVDDPRGPRFSMRTTARIHGPPGDGSLVLLGAGGDVAMRLRLLSAGEGATVTGRLRPLGAEDRYHRWRHVTAVLDVDDLVAVSGPGSFLARRADQTRRAVLAGGDYVSAADRALVSGLVVGDDRDLPPGVRADFRAAGLSHLLAVSGANVAVMLGLAAPLLRRLPLGARSVAGISVVVLFAAVTRFEPSVLRASAMAGVGMLSVLAGRPAAGMRLLTLAVGGLVLVDPFLIHSTGFRLSCAASAGILLLAPAIARRLPGRRAWLRDALAVTAAAQIGVAPVALPAFGSLPLVALPANVLVAPAVAALSVYAAASGLVTAAADQFWPGWAAPLALPATVLAGYVRAVAAVAARAPVAVGPGPLAVLVVLAGFIVRLRNRGKEAKSQTPSRGTEAARS